MRIKAAFQFQLMDLRWAVLIYYGIIITLTLLANITVVSFSAGVVGNDETAVMSGLTMSSSIFVFVVGLNSFTENFRFCLQNGMSRRTIFFARLSTAAVLSLFMSLVDQIFHTILSILGKTSDWSSASLFQLIYPQAFQSPVQGFFLSAIYGFALLLLLSNLGYGIVMLFYRLGKLGKWLVGGGIPALCLFGIPGLKMLDTLYFGEKLRAFGNAVISPIFQFAFGTYSNCIISLFVLAVFFAWIDWLLLRRAIVR